MKNENYKISGKYKSGMFIIGRTYLPGDFYDDKEETSRQGLPKQRPGVVIKKYKDFLLILFFSSQSENKVWKEEYLNFFEKNIKTKLLTPKDFEIEFNKNIDNDPNIIRSDDKKYIYFPKFDNGFLMWVHKTKISFGRNEKELFKWWQKNSQVYKNYLTENQKEVENIITSNKIYSFNILEQKEILSKKQFSKRKISNSLSKERAILKIDILGKKHISNKFVCIKKEFIKKREAINLHNLTKPIILKKHSNRQFAIDFFDLEEE